jgi:hypothetical protein
MFIVAHSCFDRRLFFVTTPRCDSAAAATVSDTHRRRLLWLRDVPPPPSDLLQLAHRRLDQDQFGSCRPPPLCSIPLRSDRCCFTLARLGGNRSRGDMRCHWSCPASGGMCCPRSCPGATPGAVSGDFFLVASYCPT